MTEADDALRRIETLIQGLDCLPDPTGRQMARGLLEVVLDLHGLALARITAGIAAAPNGPVLLSRLADDPHVRAVLLLYGLHPQEPADRIAHAVAALNRELVPDRVYITSGPIDGATARVTVHHGGAIPHDLRQRIEAAVIEAAPELESLVIDGLQHATGEMSPLMAG